MSTLNGGPGIVKNGLIFYLDAGNAKSYTGSGLTWSNIVSNTTGTLVNGPTFNSLNNGSIIFDGINDYLSLNNTLNLNTQTGFTIDMVININTVQTTYPNNWTYFYSDGNIEIGTYYTSPGVNNKFQFKDNAAAGSPFINSGNIAGSWYNITFGCNSTIPFMYQNGILIGTTSAFRSATWSVTQLFARQTDNSRFYSANLGLIRVYNRALTAAEVLQNYNAVKSRFNL